jgi:predicted small metal-binding protein
MGEPTIRTRCACGWESSGPVDEVVASTIEHGRRIHNMLGTREQVLERAEVLDPGDETALDGTPGPATG